MRFVQLIFFGNYFYGLCAVGLSIEAGLQQRYPLNSFWYYAAVFIATVLYYTVAYITDKPVDVYNKRSQWYADHQKLIKGTQAFFLFILLLYGSVVLYQHHQKIAELTAVEWTAFFLFPVTGALYYGLSNKGIGKYNLRRIGWLKPFIIGFTWAGLVTVYPVLFYCITQRVQYVFTEIGLWLFIKNFMFVTVLCIMFDIKDYAVDHNQQLKTFVVQKGLRYTIFYILIPLCLLGLVSFFYYAVVHHFHPVKIILNLIPFITLIGVAYSMHKRQSILYYLIIIDGLMLLKALCGSAGMLYF